MSSCVVRIESMMRKMANLLLSSYCRLILLLSYQKNEAERDKEVKDGKQFKFFNSSAVRTPSACLSFISS